MALPNHGNPLPLNDAQFERMMRILGANASEEYRTRLIDLLILGPALQAAMEGEELEPVPEIEPTGIHGNHIHLLHVGLVTGQDVGVLPADPDPAPTKQPPKTKAVTAISMAAELLPPPVEEKAEEATSVASILGHTPEVTKVPPAPTPAAHAAMPDGELWWNVERCCKEMQTNAANVGNAAFREQWKRQKFGRMVFYNAEEVKGYIERQKARKAALPPEQAQPELGELPAGTDYAAETLTEAKPAENVPPPVTVPAVAPAPKPEPVKTGVGPLTQDPQPGEDGVYEVEGETYVTAPVAASCLNMSTSKFNRMAPCYGSPSEVAKAWPNGATEVFRLADLKKSLFYRTNGRIW